MLGLSVTFPLSRFQETLRNNKEMLLLFPNITSPGKVFLVIILRKSHCIVQSEIIQPLLNTRKSLVKKVMRFLIISCIKIKSCITKIKLYLFELYLRGPIFVISLGEASLIPHS